MANLHRLPILGATVAAPAWERPRPARGELEARPENLPGADGADELLQVGDLAREVGKTVRAIHHYEELGLLKPHKRSKGRFRLYARDAVARVRWIGKLHDLGMSLPQIQEILALWEEAPSAPEAMRRIRAIYAQKLDEVRAQIARLTTLEREVGASLEYLDTCNTCDPSELVRACSACENHDETQAEPELVAGIYATREALRP